MELIWLDGDVLESWDDLLEHLEFLGVCKHNRELWSYKGVVMNKEGLVEILKEIVTLNNQLYDAWGLLYKIRDLPEQGKSDEDIPDDKCEAYEMGYGDAVTDGVNNSLAPIKEKIRAYLEKPMTWSDEG